MIQSHEQLRQLYAEPAERALLKQQLELDRYCLRFIALSPFVVLATGGANGAMLDASPRGGKPGFVKAPDAGDATRFYRQLSRYASAFALCADMALLTLGGALKRKEMLSARFGDILSELYLLSAALKRWQDEGRQREDFAALKWCMASGFRTIENRFAEILANLHQAGQAD